jgi:glycerol-3-phosphate O-acyltransferase
MFDEARHWGSRALTNHRVTPLSTGNCDNESAGMASRELTRPYTPSPPLRALYAHFFDRIQVDPEWASSVRQWAGQGRVVYILRSLNFIDFLALDHLTKRYNLPQIRFVNDLGLWILKPFGRGFLGSLLSNGVTPAAELKDALSRPGGSAALFLKRPPNVLDLASRSVSGGRGLRVGEDLMAALIQLQREQDAPIYLVPQTFVWTKRPDTRGTGSLDWVLGPREWPSPARVVAQLLSNYGKVTLRAGEPLNLKPFLEECGNLRDSQVQNRAVYTLLRRIERERRSILGPAGKPPDRVRQEILKSQRFRAQLKKLAPTADAEKEALHNADQMLREMQALPDGATHGALDVVLGKIFERIYAGIDIDEAGIARLRALAKESSLVLLPSHKSHIDYLVVSYVFYKAGLPLPLIVAGDNLSFFPMGTIFRHAGAFFIRRSFRGDKLYPAVVDAYVRRLIRDGYSIEVFLEGGRSRTGKLLPPKLGILSMLVHAAMSLEEKPVHFVPISIGYERIIETESFHLESSGGEKTKEDATGLLSATEILLHRYGRLNLQFGKSFTLADMATELGFRALKELSPKQTRTLTTRLANRVVDEINRVTAVTPGPLVAMALLNHHRRGLSHDKLLKHCDRLHGALTQMEARVGPALATNTGVLRPDAVREAAQMFVDAGMVEVHSASELLTGRRRRKARAGTGMVYTIVEDRRVELDTSKNMLLHFFVERSLVASSMLPPHDGPLTVSLLKERTQYLMTVLKHEFRFRSDREFDALFEQTLEDMRDRQELTASEQGHIGAGAGGDGWSGQKWLLVYASMLKNFIESYVIVLRSLAALVREPMTDKELLKVALATGQRMYLAGEIERREAVSKFVMENAIASFVEQGILRPNGGELRLADEWCSEAQLGQAAQRLLGYTDREGML